MNVIGFILIFVHLLCEVIPVYRHITMKRIIDKKYKSEELTFIQPGATIQCDPFPILTERGFSEDDVKFILENGIKFTGKPKLLSQKLDISIERAKEALDIIQSDTKTTEISLTKSEMRDIDRFLSKRISIR